MVRQIGVAWAWARRGGLSLEAGPMAPGGKQLQPPGKFIFLCNTAKTRTFASDLEFIREESGNDYCIRPYFISSRGPFG